MAGMLRTNIEEIIKKYSDDEEKAVLEILKFLEYQIGLEGNGWFDDDEELLNYINKWCN